LGWYRGKKGKYNETLTEVRRAYPFPAWPTEEEMGEKNCFTNRERVGGGKYQSQRGKVSPRLGGKTQHDEQG